MPFSSSCFVFWIIRGYVQYMAFVTKSVSSTYNRCTMRLSS